MPCVPAGLRVDISSLQTTEEAAETHGAFIVPVPELLYQPAQLDDWQIAFLLRLGVSIRAIRVFLRHHSAYGALRAFSKTSRFTLVATLRRVA